MERLRIGAVVDELKLGVRPGVEKLAAMGLDGFQVYVTRGEMHPDHMPPEARRDFKRFAAGQGLAVSALCADFGGGFGDAERNRDLVPLMKRVVDLAVDLEVSVVTTHVGVVPEEPGDPRRDAMTRALSDVGAHAEARGVSFATETGLEHGRALRAFIEGLDTRAVRVNFDPANLVMRGFDVLECVDALAPFIVHTHVKDGKRGEGLTRVGEGDVPWREYLAALRSAGYEGFYTIEAELKTDDRSAFVADAAAFLRGLAG